MSKNLPQTADWNELAASLHRANGPDLALDDALVLIVPTAVHPTASTEQARAWVAAALSGWHLHVGFDVSGVLPYAALSRDGCHVEATAPTVPLAILRAAVAVLAGDFLQ